MAEAGYTDQGDGRWLLTGELGFATVPGLLARSVRGMSGGGAIEIDLAGVTRVDSAGLALLIEWTRAGMRAGRTIRFIHVPEQLFSIAQVCGLEDILTLTH
jgi:phospholipid transport system transporter-binding protein